MKKVFGVLLILSGLMPIMLGSMCLLAYPKALEMLKFSDSHDVFQALTLFGACLVPIGIIQCLAGYWTLKNNWSGVVLGRLSGLLILMDGFILYTVISRPDLGIPDMAKGALLTVVGMLCKKTS